MTQEEANQLEPGIYRVFWAFGEPISVATVGKDYAGWSWFSPTDWDDSSFDLSIPSYQWQRVASVELVTTQRLEQLKVMPREV